MRDEVSIHIEAPPERVYDLISDVTRMGEWSPECYRCEWSAGTTGPAVGASFKGYNKKGLVRWSTNATVTSSDRPHEFAFATRDTQWGYHIEADAAGGSKVTEWYEEIKQPGALRGFVNRLAVGSDRDRQLRDGMGATLVRIKAAAEAPAG